MANQHFTHSTLRERVVEHVFVGEALRTLWRRGVFHVEVRRLDSMRTATTSSWCTGRTNARHIQFKTGTGKRPGEVSVGQALATKASGCVIWIHVNDDLEQRRISGSAGYLVNRCRRLRNSRTRSGRRTTRMACALSVRTTASCLPRSSRRLTASRKSSSGCSGSSAMT